MFGSHYGSLTPSMHHHRNLQIFKLSYVQTTAHCGRHNVSLIGSQFLLLAVFTKDPHFCISLRHEQAEILNGPIHVFLCSVLCSSPYVCVCVCVCVCYARACIRASMRFTSLLL